MIVNEETPAERRSEFGGVCYDSRLWGPLVLVANINLNMHPFNTPLEPGWGSRYID